LRESTRGLAAGTGAADVSYEIMKVAVLILLVLAVASGIGCGNRLEHFEQTIESPSRPLQPAEDVSAESTPAGVEVAWTSKAPPGNFVILRRDPDSAAWIEIGEVLGGETTTEPGGGPILRYSFLDTGVAAGRSYLCGIRVLGGPNDGPVESAPVTVP
jgi:hypothetical protein